MLNTRSDLGRLALCILSVVILGLGSPRAASAAPADEKKAVSTPRAGRAGGDKPARKPDARAPVKKRRVADPPAAGPPDDEGDDKAAEPPRDAPDDRDDNGDDEKRKVKAKTELTLGVIYDDNAALGRRGLFGADQIYDVASVIGLDTRIQTDIKDTIRFVLTGKLRSEEGRWRQYLRNTEVSLKPALELDFGKSSTLTPSVSLKLHREKEEVWGYVEVAPSLMYILFTKVGLVMEASYDFTATMYDSEAPSNTYANLDMFSHLLKLRFKIWQSQKLRFSIKTEVEHQTFDNNIAYKLAHIMFAPIEEFENPDLDVQPIKRKDWFLRAELDALWIPKKYIGISVGYRVEWDNSNLDPFNSIAHGPRLVFVFAKGIHEAYGEARLSFLDFYDFRFDTRFADTRKDIKLEAYATYQIKITDTWKVGAKVTFLSNFSNDATKNPDGTERFDPRHSRSYSRYQGTRIEAFVTYLWDTQTGAPPKKTAPELPGTIMARR